MSGWIETPVVVRAAAVPGVSKHALLAATVASATALKDGWGSRCYSATHVIRVAAVTVDAHLRESSNTGSVFLEVDCGRAGAWSGLARSADVALGHDRVVAKGRKALARNDIVSTLLQARVKAATQL